MYINSPLNAHNKNTNNKNNKEVKMKVFDFNSLNDLKPKVREVEIADTIFYVKSVSADVGAKYSAMLPLLGVEANKGDVALAELMYRMSRLILMSGMVDADGNPIMKTDAQFRKLYTSLPLEITDKLQDAIMGESKVTDEEKKTSGETSTMTDL